MTLEGTLERSGETARIRDVQVLLLGVQRGGETVERETRTDARGRFRFADLPQPAVYLIMAELDGVRFPGGRAVFDGGPEDALQTITIPLFATSEDASRLGVSTLRLTIERHEGGWYRVEQFVRIRNPDETVVVRAEGAAPLLSLGLALGHGEIVSAFGGVPSGFEPTDGRLDFLGPMLPGDREITIGYDVEAVDGRLESALALPTGVEELELFVLDSGVLIEAGDLHPARPARDANGRAYQHYLGFELRAGLELPLHIRALTRPDPGDGRFASALAAGALTLVLSLLVLQPVLREGPSAAAAEPEASPERLALLAALSELEHDFETGKLSEEDRTALRADLVRGEAERLVTARPASSEGSEPPSGSEAS